MTSCHAFRSYDLWVFCLLWALMVVAAALWLGGPAAPAPARQEAVRYMGEET